jgi:hypothetical protein
MDLGPDVARLVFWDNGSMLKTCTGYNNSKQFIVENYVVVSGIAVRMI